jgi:hypothetical protein
MERFLAAPGIGPAAIFFRLVLRSIEIEILEATPIVVLERIERCVPPAGLIQVAPQAPRGFLLATVGVPSGSPPCGGDDLVGWHIGMGTQQVTGKERIR